MKDSVNQPQDFRSSPPGDGASLGEEKRGSLLPTRARVSAPQRKKLLFDWNRTWREYPRDLCLHHLVEAQVEKTPHAMAVQDEKGALTYQELNQRANQLAHHLNSLGVQRETLVGICLEPSCELLIALVAVMKSGGAYLPLESSYPKERLDFMVRDSGMPLLITREKHLPALPEAHVRVLCLGTLPPAEGDSFTNPKNELTPENLAYVIYTSGSTGQPKGVMVPHRGLVNYLVWAAEAYELRSGAGAPVHSPISFDLTITPLFAPLLVGGCVQMLSQNLETLALALHASNPFSLVKITPAHLELLCAQWTDEGHAATRMFIVGGEALFGQSLDFWQRCAPEAALVNEYGPTETVVGCCAYFVPKSHMFDGPVPIGRPIANTQVYVLDQCLQPVPLGEPGELHIAGDGVARGYLNLPGLTAEKFVPNPFAGEDENTSQRMYKTGDLVRYLADGNLEFLGRVDDQIKLRGYRIEPAEVEASLISHPHVRNAAVVCLTNATGDQYLAAYVSANTVAPEAEDLRQHLQKRLPEYMVPASYTLLPELPLTPNGKVDRNALPPPDARDPALTVIATATENRILKLWSEALQQPVGLDDNFFALGGHSLVAVRLVLQLNEIFGLNLDPLCFYDHSTPRHVAQLIDRGGEIRRSKFVSLRSGGLDGPIVFLNGPSAFDLMADLMNGERPLYRTEVNFPPGALDAAVRCDVSGLPELDKLVLPQVELIFSHQIRDPIFLAGYSSHGLIAFEVAHHLQRFGRKVGGVLLFDADMKASRWTLLRVRARRHMRKAMKDGPPYLIKKIRDRRARWNGTAVPPNVAEQEISWKIFQRIWDHALRDYHPRPLSAPGILFRAETTIYGDVHDHDGCLGWRGLFSDGLMVTSVPGDHVTMWTEPHLRTLTHALQDSLGKLRCSAV